MNPSRRGGRSERGSRRSAEEELERARRRVAGSADTLLDLADDLEEQGRALLRQAKRIQRIVEQMDGAGGRGEEARGRERGGAGRSGGSRTADRGGGKRASSFQRGGESLHESGEGSEMPESRRAQRGAGAPGGPSRRGGPQRGGGGRGRRGQQKDRPKGGHQTG